MSARAPHLVIYLGLAFAAFILGTTTVVSWNDYAQAIGNAARVTEERARLLEAHAGRVLDAADLALRQAAEIAANGDLSELRNSRESWLKLKRLAGPLEFLDALWIGDDTGAPVLSSLQFPTPPGSAADRDYFRAHEGGDVGLFVGPPIVSRITGETLVSLSRAIRRPDGSLRGFVHASIRASYFLKFYDSLRQKDLLVEIVRGDGVPILQSPRVLPGRAYYVPAADAALVTRRARSPGDGVERIVTSAPVRGYPLFVSVGVTPATVWRGWIDRWAVSFAIALGATFAVASLTWLAWRRTVSEDFVKAALRTSERRFRAIFNNALQFTALIEPDGTILEANQAAVDLLGRPHDEVIDGVFWDMPAWHVGSDGAATMRQRVRLAAAGETIRGQVEVRTAESGGAWIDFSIRPITDESGRIVQLLAEGRDVTDQKRAEAVALQAQKMEAVGHLTGGVAHDFNNLLTVIQGNTELLQRRLCGTDAARHVIAIERAAARGASLTRQLLAFARRQPLQPERVDLKDWIGDVAELVERTLSADIRIEADIPDDLWPVHVDAAQFELAVLNIAVNARDAMPGGGILRIAARNLDHPPGDSAAADGQFVSLSLSDTGSGIDPALVKRVFEPFFTTKETGKGTGLGLSQVYGFAKQSGGDVRLESRAGRGTTVTLLLPRAGALAPFAEIAPPDGRRPHVLVVEDNPDVARIATLFLDQLGYRATVAGSAGAALDRLASEAPPDLVFSDIVMPGEFSGLDLARRVRTHHPSLPVLLTTGFGDAARDAAAVGVSILPKPYTLTALDGALRRCLRAMTDGAGTDGAGGPPG